MHSKAEETFLRVKTLGYLLHLSDTNKLLFQNMCPYNKKVFETITRFLYLVRLICNWFYTEIIKMKWHFIEAWPKHSDNVTIHGPMSIKGA